MSSKMSPFASFYKIRQLRAALKFLDIRARAYYNDTDIFTLLWRNI